MNKIKEFFAVPRNFNIFAVVLLAVIGTATFFIVRSIIQDDPTEFTEEETHDILAEIAQNNNSEVFAALTYSAPGLEDDSDQASEELPQQSPPSILGEIQKDLAQSGDPTINSPLPVIVPTTPILISEGSEEVSEDGSRGGREQEILDNMPPHPEELKNVYRSAKTDYTAGPKASACWYYRIDDYARESYEYFDEEHSFSSYVSIDGDGDLIQESTYKYGSGIHNSEYYAGGDFVGRRAYDKPEFVDYSWLVDADSYPNAVPIDDAEAEDNAIRARFGSGAYISGVEEDGEKLYYYITAPSSAYCGTDYTTVWDVYKVDTDDFTIIQVKSFLESIRASNLLSTRDIESTRQEITYDKALRRFDLAAKHSVPTVTVDYENYVYKAAVEAGKVIEHLENAAQKQLWPSEEAYQIFAIDGSHLPERIKNESYYQRRDFYSTDTKGQERWDSIDSYRKSLGDLKLYFGDNGYEYFSIKTTYAGGAPEYHYNISILVNNEPMAVVKSLFTDTWRVWRDIDLPSSYPISYPTKTVVSYPDSYGGYSVLRYDSNISLYSDSMYPGENGVEYNVDESSYYNMMTEHRPYSLYSPANTREFAPLNELISDYFDEMGYYYY